MKNKNYYLILLGFILAGIGSIFLYKQQQEARYLEFEGYEIFTIENRIKALYNPGRTDLAKNISVEELEALDEVLLELKEKDLGRQNEKRIKLMYEEYSMIQDLLDFEKRVNKLFVEQGILDKGIRSSEVEKLDQQILTYVEITNYYERNKNTLDDAKKQITRIEAAVKLIESLFIEEDSINEEVTREEEEKALNLIKKIKNKAVREELISHLEKVSLFLAEREELLAQEELEALDEVGSEEVEEAEDISVDTGSDNLSNQNSSNNSDNQSIETDGNDNSTNNTSSNNSNNSDVGDVNFSNPVVSYRTETIEEEIPSVRRVVTENPNWETGTEVIISNGEQGLRITTHRTPIYHDGTEGTVEVSSEIIKEPTPTVVQIGTKEPASDSEE